MNRIFYKSSLSLFLILITTGSLYAQESSPNKPSTKSPFFFDITYKNRGTKSKHLIKVGIKIDKFDASYMLCFPTGARKYYKDVLQPLADYVVRFHLATPETIIDADPPIEVKPDEAARFTISYFPSSVGVCTLSWSTAISGILIFDDGEEIYTNSDRITSDEVKKYIERTPEEADLLAATKHRNINIRAQVFSQLHKSTLDKESIKFLIKRGLDDEDARIRAAAAIAASRMGFKEFAGKIASLLKKRLNAPEVVDKEEWDAIKRRMYDDKREVIGKDEMITSEGEIGVRSIDDSFLPFSQKEMADYCEALGGLKDPDTIDVLISALDNLSFIPHFKASDALIRLSHPNVVTKVRPLLHKDIKWIGDNYYLIDRYREICKVIIAYRDMESTQILLSIIAKPSYSSLASELVRELSYSGYLSEVRYKDQIIRDPFMLALRPAFEKALKDPDDSHIRSEALSLLCLMSLSDNIIQDYIRIGLKDSDFNNIRRAGMLAAKLGYKELVGEIILLMKSTKSTDNKAAYCEALQAFKVPCK